MKHECACSKMIVDREHTISNLLRARLGVWDWTFAIGEEVFGASEHRHEHGENDKLMED